MNGILFCLNFPHLEHLNIKGVKKMPRGKELSQLPKSNNTIDVGTNTKEVLKKGFDQQIKPQPGEVDRENEDMI
jgi:hypothetical protein